MPLNPIICDLTSALLPRLARSVDVLVFNPPYVETEMDEMHDAQVRGAIDTTWAGGADGMTVTNRVLHGGLVEVRISVPWVQNPSSFLNFSLPQTLLSDRGVFYLVTVQQNKPDQIIVDMRARGLVGEVGASPSLGIDRSTFAEPPARSPSNDARVASTSRSYASRGARSHERLPPDHEHSSGIASILLC